MKRAWITWVLFAAAIVVALAAMAWVSVTALRLDRARAESERQAYIEENVRLALWRLDSAAAPLVAGEGARALGDIRGVDTAALTKAGGKSGRSVPVLSTVLPSPFVVAYFRLDCDGNLVAPLQMKWAFDSRGNPSMVIVPDNDPKRTEGGLGVLRAILDYKSLDAALGGTAHPSASYYVNGENPPAQDQPAVQNRQQAWRGQDYQNERNGMEYQARYQSNVGLNSMAQKTFANNESFPVVAGGDLMRPIWVKGSLVLARRSTWLNVPCIYGCLVDWPALRGQLLGAVREILPNATLEPWRGPSENRGESLMAALPVRLVPGAVTWEAAPGLSAVETSLIAAWACFIVAGAAVLVLLVGVMKLSERRGAFVSAVTHELRTPLTTFRMYTEMLEAGIVRDEETKKKYVSTLKTEAERLGHLVENVLAYARLESGRARGRIEPVSLSALAGRARELLSARAEQAGMKLVFEAEGGAEKTTVLADASAVEQILFNLVDNASKYASDAEDKRIHLSVRATPGGGEIGVCDHGRGILPEESRRLFRPFHRHARDAAGRAPGIGLGLALSRRLAREMNGDLRSELRPGDGACFILTLPTAKA